MLTEKINHIEQSILALVRARFPTADVFSFGAVDLSPEYLAIWIKTDTDAQRDELDHDATFRETLRNVLVQENYPAEAIAHVSFAFQSEETVARDYGGNWWYAVK
ncbi:MAG: hypothetical protein JXA21_01450 [Anaerolineae bacterium]|nr:hypothetical protein [Anaerolineae bacterium]